MDAASLLLAFVFTSQVSATPDRYGYPSAPAATAPASGGYSPPPSVIERTRTAANETAATLSNGAAAGIDAANQQFRKGWVSGTNGQAPPTATMPPRTATQSNSATVRRSNQVSSPFAPAAATTPVAAKPTRTAPAPPPWDNAVVGAESALPTTTTTIAQAPSDPGRAQPVGAAPSGNPWVTSGTAAPTITAGREDERSMLKGAPVSQTNPQSPATNSATNTPSNGWGDYGSAPATIGKSGGNVMPVDNSARTSVGAQGTQTQPAASSQSLSAPQFPAPAAQQATTQPGSEQIPKVNLWDDNRWNQPQQNASPSQATIQATPTATGTAAGPTVPANNVLTMPSATTPGRTDQPAAPAGPAAPSFVNDVARGVSNATSPTATIQTTAKEPGPKPTLAPTITADQPPWMPLIAVSLGLAGSLGANLFLGWSYLDARAKYHTLVRKTASKFRRTAPAAA